MPGYTAGYTPTEFGQGPAVSGQDLPQLLKYLRRISGTASSGTAAILFRFYGEGFFPGGKDFRDFGIFVMDMV